MTTKDLRGQNVIYCPDVKARIEELEGLEQGAESSELRALHELVSNPLYLGYESRAYLIRATYFTEHVKEKAMEHGLIPKESELVGYVDWQAFAGSVQPEFKVIYFDGVCYYIPRY